jgi:hypothetical protein
MLYNRDCQQRGHLSGHASEVPLPHQCSRNVERALQLKNTMHKGKVFFKTLGWDGPGCNL